MPKKSKKNSIDKVNFLPLNNILNVSRVLNDNKIFAGIVMLIMNIGSKYINIDLNDSQENYIKYSLGRQIIIFSILWVGTRDIFTSLILTVLFIIFVDYLFNENSYYCIIPKRYRNKNINKDKPITEKEINNAIDTLKRARQNKEYRQNEEMIENTLYKENFI